MHTVESEFSNFMIEFLGEIETEFENVVAFYQGPRRIRIMKNRSRIYCDPHSLNKDDL